ncbi:MAG: phage holin family protein [Bacilli bacterium]|nr:phage holin family protein [Bacilli bacterium]
MKTNLFNNFLDWIIKISGYSLTLYLVDTIFNAFEVDNIIYYFIASALISILNKTIKPIVFKLTLPITGLTFGLFYFVVNFLMLEIVDFVLGRHFDIYGLFWGIFIAFVISVINFFIEEIIVNPLIRSCEK